MQVPDLARIALALDVLDIHLRVERPRAIQRHQRNQVVEAVRLHPNQQVTHSRRLQLEHLRRLCLLQQRVSLRVVKRQRIQVQRRLKARIDRAQALVQQRHRAQAKKIELGQADLLDILHVELGNRHVGLPGLEIQRREVGERTRRDHHPGGMPRSIAHHPFQLQRHLVQVRARRVFRMADQFPELRGVLVGFRQGDPQLVRHRARDAVAIVVRGPEHTPDIADRRLGRHRAVGDDLRHAVLPVALAHVLDHPVAVLVAEVDVEVRHADAVGVQETFEQEPVAQRIKAGDPEGVSHQRSRAGAAPGADRDVVVARPLHEVRDDHEIAAETGLVNDSEFMLEPLPVVGLRPHHLPAGLKALQATG